MDLPDWLGDVKLPIQNPYLSLIKQCRDLGLETILGILLHFQEHGSELSSSELEILNQLKPYSEKPFSYIFLFSLKNGVPLEKLANLMSWSEFEHVTAMIMDEAGWTALNNFRYFGEGVPSRERHRFEIDLIAYKKPYVLLVDNKHHARTSPSVTRDWVEKQQNRTYELYEQLPVIHDTAIFSWMKTWPNALLIPMIVTWRDISIIKTNRTPIVSSKVLLDLLANFSVYFIDSEWFNLKWERIG